MVSESPNTNIKERRIYFLLLLLFFFFFAALPVMWDLHSGIKPMPSAMEVQNPDHWTTREFLNISLTLTLSINFYSSKTNLYQDVLSVA